MKIRKKMVACLIICGVVLMEGKAYAAPLFMKSGYNIETILADMAFYNIYSDLYKEKVEEEQVTGEKIAEYACKFIGNPYVWGGTSLTNGSDCSGFVQSVYAHFGIKVPRTSWEQRQVGKPVTYDHAKMGDLICYEGHVGIYAGDGQIVNARSPEEGIGITSATYDQILAVRRVLY